MSSKAHDTKAYNNNLTIADLDEAAALPNKNSPDLEKANTANLSQYIKDHFKEFDTGIQQDNQHNDNGVLITPNPKASGANDNQLSASEFAKAYAAFQLNTNPAKPAAIPDFKASSTDAVVLDLQDRLQIASASKIPKPQLVAKLTEELGKYTKQPEPAIGAPPTPKYIFEPNLLLRSANKKSQVEAQGVGGMNALTEAAKAGNSAVVQTLVNTNADKNLTNDDGKTAAMLAREAQ